MQLPGGGFYPVSAMALLSIGALCLAIVRLMFAGSIQHTTRSYETLELRLGENMVSLRALIDTGNTLKDPMTNEPVLVLDWSAAARLLPESNLREQDFLHPAELMRRLMREYPDLRARLVPYRAVGVSQGLLLAVRCERKGKNGKITPALAAFSPTPVSGDGAYEALTGGAA